MSEHPQSPALSDNVNKYFAYMIEDRFGSSAEISELGGSVVIILHEEADVEPEVVHSFCMNLMVINMHEFGVFIPFKVYDPVGELITLETYADLSSDELPSFDGSVGLVDEEFDEDFNDDFS